MKGCELVRDNIYAEAETHGVTALRQTRAESVARRHGGIALKTTVGELNTELGLVAAGVRPRSYLASSAGTAVGASRSLTGNEYLGTSLEGTYAAGDCADARHAVTKESVWTPLGA